MTVKVDDVPFLAEALREVEEDDAQVVLEREFPRKPISNQSP